MALTACGECGGEVSTKAKACPKCGATVPRTKWWLWVPLALFGAFMGYGLIASASPQAQEKAKARASISYCWEEQERKSLSAGARQFVAGACEMMEKDFEQKYGVRP